MNPMTDTAATCLNPSSPALPQSEIEALQARLQEAEAVLHAIRHHEVDALVVKGPLGDRVYTLSGADHPYRLLVDNMYEGAVTMVSQGTVFFCNRGFAKLVRAAEGQVVGSPIANHVAAEDRPLFEELLERGTAGKANGEVHLLGADGTRVPVYLALNALNLEDVQGVCILVTDLTEHKRSQEMLAQERLTRAILAQVSEALVVCDTSDVIIRASDKARQLAGLALIGVPFVSAFALRWEPDGADPADSRQNAPSTLSALCAGAGNVRREAIYERDGEAFHLLLSAGPLRGDDGELLGHVVTLADISERRRAEMALQESRTRFELATQGAREVMYDIDVASGTVWRSAGLFELLGVRPEDAEPEYAWWPARIHPDDLQRVEQELLDVHDAAKPPHRFGEYRVRNAAGDYVWVQDRAQIRRDAAGAAVRVVGSISSIEERKCREAQIEALNTQLRQRVEEFEVLFSKAPLAIAVAEEPDCRRIRVNPYLQHLMGLAPDANASVDAPPGERAPLRFFRDGRELQAAELPQQLVRDTGKPVTNAEFEMLSADGRMWALLGHALPLFDADGRMRGNVAFYLDITERKRMERALTQADRRKDEFIATLGHELRNPLAPIRNAVELLRAAAAQPPQALDMIERHVMQLTRLVDDLLDVARVSEGKIVLRKEPLRVADAVTHALEAARPIIEGRGHHLEVSLPPAPLWVAGDEARLIQVIVNLLNNAAKYMDPGGHITLAAQSANGQVVLRVKDRGMGIAPELLSGIFDLFNQGDRASNRAEGGLGIGLTLVRKLVELHGGSVVASSAGVGQGSEFTVRLPAISPSQAAQPVAATAKASTRPLRILVVDDNVDSAESMAMLLRLQKHHVETAHSGPEAVEAALAAPPDVLLLDIGLPGMDGYEVARDLRAQPQTRAAVLVALTGYGQPQDRQRSAEAGFDHHLVKPVEPESLNGILAAVSAVAR